MKPHMIVYVCHYLVRVKGIIHKNFYTFLQASLSLIFLPAIILE